MGQPTLSLTKPLAITGVGVLSAAGHSFSDFSRAVMDQRPMHQPIEGMYEDPMPCTTACVIPDFQIRKSLGPKGTSFFDRITGLMVTTSGMALADTDFVVTEENRTRVGITLGSSTGSAKSTSDFSKETMVQERPYLVNPLLFPNTVMNCAAGQAAIWHKLKGVNATVSGGQLSSLMAMRYASMTIRQGYADVLLVGGVEEFTPHTAWGITHSGALRGTETAIGEGCAIFVLEDSEAVRAGNRVPGAELLSCEISYLGQGAAHDTVADGLARCISHALYRAGVDPQTVWGVSGAFTGHPVNDETEMSGITRALKRQPEQTLQVKRLVGECFDASGALQLAGLLALFQETPADHPRIGLVTSVGHDGSCGCAVIREGHLWR